MSDAVDLRPELGPVRDQGPRGTCLAFAVTAGHEQARRRRRGNLPDDLGEEILYWACKQVDGDQQPGTSPKSATRAIADTGQSAAELWPYDGGRDETATDYVPPAAAIESVALRRATLTGTAADLDTLRELMRRAHIVVLGLEVWPAFYDAHDGDLGVPARADLLGELHAVALAGFDDDAQKLLLRNSWGDTWGDAGYGRLPYAALRTVGRGAWILEDDVDN